jgi:hypothetical protein
MLGSDRAIASVMSILPTRRSRAERNVSRHQMVLSDRDHGACLGTLLAFPLVDEIVNLIAIREGVEAVAGHGVLVEIDLIAIA